jgi:hypothetical protein
MPFKIISVCDICGAEDPQTPQTIGEMFQLAAGWLARCVTAKLSGLPDDVPLRTRCNACGPMPEPGKVMLGPGSAALYEVPEDEKVKPS